MEDILTRDEYEDSLQLHAEVLADGVSEAIEADEYSDKDEARFELARGVIDGHEWWHERQYGLVDHAAVVHYAGEDGIEVGQRLDLTAYIEGKEPEEMVKTLAYLAFEEHVISEATDLAATEA